MAKSKTSAGAVPRPSMFPPRDPDAVWRCKVCSSPVRWVKTSEGGRHGIDHVDAEGPNAGQSHQLVCSHPHRSPWGRITKCSTCSEHIVWAVTSAGKRMPVDAAMRNDGNVRLERQADGSVLAIVGTITDPLYGGHGFVSHFATCGQAAQHRRAKAEAPAETHVGPPQDSGDGSPGGEVVSTLGGQSHDERPANPATATGEETGSNQPGGKPGARARTATDDTGSPNPSPSSVAGAPLPAPWVPCPGGCGLLIDPARELCVGCTNGDTGHRVTETVDSFVPVHRNPDTGVSYDPDRGFGCVPYVVDVEACDPPAFVPDFEPCDFAPIPPARKCALCPNTAVRDGEDTCQQCRDTFTPDQPPDRQRVLMSARQPSCLACDRCGATAPIGDGKADGVLCGCGGWRTKAGGKLLDAGMLVLPIERDAAAGKAAAVEGAEQAYAAADLDWKVAAMMAVRQIARERRDFTTDDVWERIPRVREPRALGAVMLKASKAGVIEKSDRVRESDRPEAHSNPKAVWLSLTYTGE